MAAKLLTTVEVAEMLSKPPAYIYEAAERIGLPRIRIGRHYRYRPEDIEAWLASQAVDQP